MSKFLVTGGCGFIGSHLVDSLIGAGHQVRVLDNLAQGITQNLNPAAELMEGDITDAGIVREAMQGVAGCFHLAAIASVERSNEDWQGTHQVNLAGSINIFDAAARSGPIPVVYASSAAVYGDNEEVPLSETAELRPMSAYGADKIGCELHARVAALVHGVPTTGFRMFNVFGPRQQPGSSYSGVITIFVDRLSRGLPLTIYGDGEQVRDFIYVGDAVRFLMAGIFRDGRAYEVFNVCTGRGTSINRLASTLAEIMNQPLDAQHEAPRRGDIRLSIGDPLKAETRLGLKAEISLRDGLQETIIALRPQ